jgi:hypothetical protein
MDAVKLIENVKVNLKNNRPLEPVKILSTSVEQ